MCFFDSVNKLSDTPCTSLPTTKNKGVVFVGTSTLNRLVARLVNSNTNKLFDKSIVFREFIKVFVFEKVCQGTKFSAPNAVFFTLIT